MNQSVFTKMTLETNNHVERELMNGRNKANKNFKKSITVNGIMEQINQTTRKD